MIAKVATDGCRELITVIEYISGDGRVFPPYIVILFKKGQAIIWGGINILILKLQETISFLFFCFLILSRFLSI